MTFTHSKIFTREQIRDIMRIHAIDLAARRLAGFERGTYGLTARLAQRYKVKPRVIRDIIHARGRRKRYRDISRKEADNYGKSIAKHRKNYAAAASGAK